MFPAEFPYHPKETPPAPLFRRIQTPKEILLLRFLLPLLCCLLIPVTASAEWTARLAPHAPEYLLAADKSRKLLFQVERFGSDPDPVVTKEFDCIHGRREGDKQKEGDLRTPEGVYFITHKITQKLDFMEYGPHAFNLNYPNPADRLRKKTGSGIWLHSKGQPIAGLTTRGCMAIEQEEITNLVPILVPGTPVVIAEHLEGAPFKSEGPAQKPVTAGASATGQLPPSAGTSVPLQAALQTMSNAETTTRPVVPDKAAQEHPQPPLPPAAINASPAGDGEKVLRQTLAWMDDNQRCSEDIFRLYDQKNYPRASRENISALRKRIRADFQKQEDLFLDREGIRLLEGPGYWVSCFIKSHQYRGEYLHGLQVLYWMADEKGEYRIIGELWIRN